MARPTTRCSSSSYARGRLWISHIWIRLKSFLFFRVRISEKALFYLRWRPLLVRYLHCAQPVPLVNRLCYTHSATPFSSPGRQHDLRVLPEAPIRGILFERSLRRGNAATVYPIGAAKRRTMRRPSIRACRNLPKWGAVQRTHHPNGVVQRTPPPRGTRGAHAGHEFFFFFTE